jgi:MFS family permease
VLGFGALAIGAVFLTSAVFESLNNLVVGRLTDRHGTLPPVLAGLAAATVGAACLPWPRNPYLLAVLLVSTGVTFGAFFTPGMTMLTHVSEDLGLDYGYTFALVNLAWAPGDTLGAAGGAALSHASSDAVPYLALSGICALTLAVLWRARARGYAVRTPSPGR